MKTKRQIWECVVDLLSFAQYKTTMGGDMSYDSKFKRAMKASKSRKIQALCLEGLDSPASLGALQRDNALTIKE